MAPLISILASLVSGLVYTSAALANTASSDVSDFPPDAAEYLRSLPGAKISPDLIIARAIRYSDSFKAVQAESHRISVPYLESRQAIDTRFKLRGERTTDQTEQSNLFAPSNNNSTRFSLGAETYFRSGTGLSAEISHGLNEFDSTSFSFALTSASTISTSTTTSTTKVYETRGTLGITQNLWKDAFGIGTRASLEAGERGVESAESGFQDAVEGWVLDLVEIFYNAWLAQAQVEAARKSVKRQERLLKITRIRASRGTAERPDLIQVKNALVRSRLALTDAEQALAVIWRDLVTSLKFPEHWIQIDASKVPMMLDEPTTVAKDACGPEGQLHAAPSETAATKQASLAAQASILREKAADSLSNPQAQAFASLTANGVDNSSGPTFGEAFSTKHPAWVFGVELQVPLFDYESRSQLQQARANRERDEAQAEIAASSLKVNWINQCSDLHRHLRNQVQLQENFEDQLSRVELEERRFRLGRVPLLNIIEADGDATDAEVLLRNTQIKSRLSAWKIRRMLGQIGGHLEKIKDL